MIAILHFYQAHVSRALAVLSGTLVLAIFLYGALLLLAVAHAAKLSAAEQEIATLSGEVATLQNQYLSHTKALSPKQAQELGFVAPKESAVVYASAAKPLSLNGR